MRHRRTTLARLLAVLAAMAMTATACGGGGGGGSGAGGGSLGAIDLSGTSFTVGSKEFTEQRILGQIALQALEATGADVQDQTGITGTQNVRAALTSGEIDMYWEYTGTGWSSHLQRETADAPRDPEQLYQAVKNDDLAQNQIVWLDRAPMNNAFAIATASGRGQQLGVTTLTDYAALANRDPAQARMCAAAEFLARDDGLPALEKVYGFDLSGDTIAELELALIPSQVASGQSCDFGEVFETDGRTLANNLTIIEDDKDAFVDYNAAMTVRQDVFERNQRLADVFNPIAARLTSDVVRGLNEQVEVDGELSEEVAEKFLRDNGFIG